MCENYFSARIFSFYVIHNHSIGKHANQLVHTQHRIVGYLQQPKRY